MTTNPEQNVLGLSWRLRCAFTLSSQRQKLLLGKEEKEVLVEENWWGQYKDGGGVWQTPPPLPQSSLRRRSLLLFLHPVGIPAVPRPGRTPCNRQRDLLPPPSPSPFPLSGSCALHPLLSPLGFLQQRPSSPSKLTALTLSHPGD